MTLPLISIIMSTYNESIEELKESVESILNQSYSNIEFIIINDNPENQLLKKFLKSLTDERVKVYENSHNKGLVESLNIALSHIHGHYVARMDADDISMRDRLQRQYDFLNQNSLDMVGSDIQLINEDGEVLQNRMHFPISEKDIRKCIRWGSCMPHPTWLVKTWVYKELGGYRKIPNCEDYDFILRVLVSNKVRIGNVSDVCLKYRVRETGISQSNKAQQYILRLYLSKMFTVNKLLNEQEILQYRISDEFNEEIKKYDRYIAMKKKVRRGEAVKLFEMLFNKYFYYDVIEKFYLKYRERK